MKTQKPHDSGSSLLIALMVILVVSTATGMAVYLTGQTTRVARRTGQMESLQATADAYIDWAYGYWKAQCQANPTTVAPAASLFSGLTAPTSTLLPQPSGFTSSLYTIEALKSDFTKSTGSPDRVLADPGGGSSYYYLASVDLTAPTMQKTPVTVRVRRVLEKKIQSPWQYAIFYNDMLEFHPSPQFEVNGWVHSNGKIYTSPDGGNSLTFDDKVTYADSYTAGYAPNDYKWRGKSDSSTFDDSVSHPSLDPGNSFAPGVTPALVTRQDPFGISPSQFSTTDSNDNNDGYREIIERPDSAFTDTFSASSSTGTTNPRYYDYADVRVLIGSATNAADTTVNIIAPSGKTVNAGNLSSQSSSDQAFFNAVNGAITTNETITNYRESATDSNVRLSSLDVSKLDTSKISGWNGVIWMSDIGAGQTGANNKRGIRVKNGSTLPTGGLTVVSENPMYVQGSFNTSSTWQPAALVGDSINVLSNAWKDSDSSVDITASGNTKRIASDTTINAAFLAGIVPDSKDSSGNEHYSGGVENFPRFLENWSGKTFTYNGSMVELFQSKQATGHWDNNSSKTYSPPKRVWAFDTGFRTSPPPGKLMDVSYTKQRWYLK